MVQNRTSAEKPVSDEEFEVIRDDINREQPALVIKAMNDTDARKELARYIRHNYSQVIKRDVNRMEYILRELVGSGFIEEILMNKDVTDIGWNGSFLTVETNDEKMSLSAADLGGVSDEYIERVVKKLTASENKEFNASNPLLDALKDGLRIASTFKSNSPYGTTLSIRITRPKLALNKDNFKIFAPDYVLEFMHKIMITRANVTISGITGTGKSVMANGTVITPEGKSIVRDIKLGDFLIDMHGNPTKVTGVYPQGKKRVYEVTLKDGRKVKCNDEHLWSYYDYKDKNILKTRTTKQLLDSKLQLSNSTYKYSLPLTGAVEHTEKNLPVDPYLVGLFLGNGILGSRYLEYSSPDNEIPDAIANIIDAECAVKNKSNYTYQFRTGDEVSGHKLYTTEDIFGELPELMNKKAINKYIPTMYMFGSIDQRLELLRGLMDSDGSVLVANGNRNRIRYGTISKKLADDVRQLFLSLGYICHMGSSTRKDSNTEYEVKPFVPNEDKYLLFKYSVKRNKALEMHDVKDRKTLGRVAITDIKDLGYEAEQICFMVDNPEHLFLTEDYVVTHNTELQKLMMSFIPATDRIIMIEDVLETHAKELFPDKDIYSWVTSAETSITDFVKASLRNNPNWIMVSETRGSEAREMLQAVLTGNNIVTTLHSIDASSVPKRFANMIATGYANANEDSIMEDVLTNFDFGFHIKKIFVRNEKTGEGKLIRYLSEIMEFSPKGNISLFSQKFYKGQFLVTTNQLSKSYQERLGEKFLSFKFPELNDVPRDDINNTKEGQILLGIRENYGEKAEMDLKTEVYGDYEDSVAKLKAAEEADANLLAPIAGGSLASKIPSPTAAPDVNNGATIPGYAQPISQQQQQPQAPQQPQMQQYTTPQQQSYTSTSQNLNASGYAEPQMQQYQQPMGQQPLNKPQSNGKVGKLLDSFKRNK